MSGPGLDSDWTDMSKSFFSRKTQTQCIANNHPHSSGQSPGLEQPRPPCVLPAFHLHMLPIVFVNHQSSVKISLAIHLSNLNIYSNFNLFLFLSWHLLSKHSSYTVIWVLFPLLFSYLFQTQLQCFFQSTEVSISYFTYLSSDSLLPWHSYYLSSIPNNFFSMFSWCPESVRADSKNACSTRHDEPGITT